MRSSRKTICLVVSKSGVQMTMWDRNEDNGLPRAARGDNVMSGSKPGRKTQGSEILQYLGWDREEFCLQCQSLSFRAPQKIYWRSILLSFAEIPTSSRQE